MDYSREFLEEAAQIVIKAQGYLDDKDLMKVLEPVITEMGEAAQRLKGFDFKSMRELAGKKELEEQNEGGAPSKVDDQLPGEDKSVYKVMSKA